MSHGTSAVLTAALELTEREPTQFDLAFVAVSQPCPWPKAYGGDMVAQAAAAAMRSVTDGKVMHSMHSYFMRPVDIGQEVLYEVELLRDGRGYSTRQVRGYQNGKPVYVCLAGFAVGDHGAQEFAPVAPLDVPAPETLPSVALVSVAALFVELVMIRCIPPASRAGRPDHDDGAVQGLLERWP